MTQVLSAERVIPPALEPGLKKTSHADFKGHQAPYTAPSVILPPEILAHVFENFYDHDEYFEQALEPDRPGRQTLCTLMRVSKAFYSLAAPILYRTVRVHGRWPIQFNDAGTKCPLLSKTETLLLASHDKLVCEGLAKQINWGEHPPLARLKTLEIFIGPARKGACSGIGCPLVQHSRPTNVCFYQNEDYQKRWQPEGDDVARADALMSHVTAVEVHLSRGLGPVGLIDVLSDSYLGPSGFGATSFQYHFCLPDADRFDSEEEWDRFDHNALTSLEYIAGHIRKPGGGSQFTLCIARDMDEQHWHGERLGSYEDWVEDVFDRYVQHWDEVAGDAELAKDAKARVSIENTAAEDEQNETGLKYKCWVYH